MVAIGDNGRAVAVWGHDNGGGTYTDVWANAYIPQVGWGTATRINTGSDISINPQVAVDPNGNAVVVWQVNTGVFNIMASAYR
jgi:hypothetical protein